MSKTYKLVLMLLVFSSMLFAQKYNISGIVSDANTGENLMGTNVYIKGINIGAVTDADGKYVINNVPKGTYEVRASFVGYVSKTLIIAVTNNLDLNFTLDPSAILLGEAVVKSTRATLRETPVVFTEITGEEIEFKLASRDVAQMLNTTPNVYSSIGGGAAGDANLYVRGFNQRYVAVMINGVPVNDMENGWVYWSNWAGLGDVTENIQVQRGLGASPYSVNAVGGVINVTTKGVGNAQDFVKFKTEFGSDNLSKQTIAFSTSLTKNWGLTALVSKKTWDGWVKQTPLDEFTYFMSLGGVMGDHSLQFSAVGSPQQHGQRDNAVSFNEYATRGADFNPDYGYLHGEVLAWEVNNYHKPQFSLEWNWQTNEKSILSTIAYYSIGSGYGTGGFFNGSWIGRDEGGLIDWDAIYDKNTATGESQFAIRESHNNHFWTGILSTYSTDLSNNLNLNFGIDGRYYIGEHYQQVRNLIGGDYVFDDNNVNKPVNNARVGDKINYYNDGFVRQIGGFAQLEYKKDKISLFVNGSASTKGYQRVDYFNFLDSDSDQETDWENFIGFTGKAGLNYNINDNNNVFVNGGYFSNQPKFDNVFDFSNNTYEGVENEKIMSFELGYGHNSEILAFLTNVYYTQWKDRAINGSSTIDDIGYNYNIVGADQNHYGVEFEGRVKATNNLEVNATFSYAKNKIGNDTDVFWAPDDRPEEEIRFQTYTKDLYVGDFPQTQASLGLTYTTQLGNGGSFYFNPVFQYFGRFYSDFDPDDRQDAGDRAQPWRLPNYNMLNVHTGYSVVLSNLFVKKISIGLHVFNALNVQDYIVYAEDGSDHSKTSAEGFLGRPRWSNLSFTFNF